MTSSRFGVCIAMLMVLGCSNKSAGRYSATSPAIGGGVVLRTLDLKPDETAVVTESRNGQLSTLTGRYSTKDDKIECLLLRDSGKEKIRWELKKEGEHLVLTYVQSAMLQTPLRFQKQ